MKELERMYEDLGVSRAVYAYGEEILDCLKPRFAAIDQNAEYNQAKVLHAMEKTASTRPALLPRPATATTIWGAINWRRSTPRRSIPKPLWCAHRSPAARTPWQLHCRQICCPVTSCSARWCAPYDTLEEVIGIRESKCSLKEYGVSYRQVDLLPDGSFDYDGIRAAITEKTKLITIQRSKGYATRPSFSVQKIGELIAFCKSVKPGVTCMVDNCYGEFVETIEPSGSGRGYDRRQPDQKPGRRSRSPSAGISAARANASSAAHTGSPRPVSGRRSARTWACFPASIRASSSRQRSSPARSRAQFSRQTCMKSWASAWCRTARSRATTSFRQSSWEAPSGCWRSARAFRRRLRSTAT